MIAQRPAFIVSRAAAMRRRTHHQFVPGLGYIAHAAPPDLPPTSRGNKNCEPPTGTPDGSIHLIKPPTGAPPMLMTWVAAERAWASTKPGAGNRLAWPTAHLMRAGWEYDRPVHLVAPAPPR
jgi:hypothetical protein